MEDGTRRLKTLNMLPFPDLEKYLTGEVLESVNKIKEAFESKDLDSLVERFTDVVSEIRTDIDKEVFTKDLKKHLHEQQITWGDGISIGKESFPSKEDI